MPRTTITFTGLFVFRHDARNNRFEVGVLRARAQPHSHILQIEVTPDPATGDDSLVFNPDDLESIVHGGDVRWSLDVELNGQPVEGLEFNDAEPSDRLNPTSGNREDYGWIINIERNPFHAPRLPRAANRLQPVIYLKKGRLFTSCKTDSVDIITGGEPDTATEFGYIAGATSLRFDTSGGEEAVLRFGPKQELFRCVNSDQTDYDISIMNTPLSGMGGGHFHLFYDRLFQQVPTPDRRDLTRHLNPIRSPTDRCPADPSPDPFKCGGVRVDDGSDPLG